MPSLIQPHLPTMTPDCHPPHPTPALFKSHSYQLPSSRYIESAHALQCDPRFLAAGAFDTALGLLDNLRIRTYMCMHPFRLTVLIENRLTYRDVQKTR
jgi:hypothetical protein